MHGTGLHVRIQAIRAERFFRQMFWQGQAGEYHLAGSHVRHTHGGHAAFSGGKGFVPSLDAAVVDVHSFARADKIARQRPAHCAYANKTKFHI